MPYQKTAQVLIYVHSAFFDRAWAPNTFKSDCAIEQTPLRWELLTKWDRQLCWLSDLNRDRFRLGGVRSLRSSQSIEAETMRNPLLLIALPQISNRS